MGTTRITDADTFARENLLAYTGDVDAAAHGGVFLNLNRDHHENGYIEALRICRLDDAPFSSLILVESLTILVDKPDATTSSTCGLLPPEWNAAADCCGLTREEYDALDERGKILADAEIFLGYGRYDPAELGYQHHTFVVLTETLDEAAMAILETGSLRPDLVCATTDDDGDEVFDEPAFWAAVQERADATFTDLTSDDNLSREEG